MSEVRALAGRLLPAFARSDLELIGTLATDDVIVLGTDVGERWDDRASLLAALDEMRALGLRAEWDGEPVCGDDWACGTARYRLADGQTIAVRVTFVFRGAQLCHAHFSIAQAG